MTSIVYDYTKHAGPWCVDHKSSQCIHAIEEIADRKDAHPLRVFLEEMKVGSELTVAVPLWTSFFMWEDLKFTVVHAPNIGAHGALIDRGKRISTFDLGVNRLLRGESAEDLSRTMVQQFEDIMELDRPQKLPGCKSGGHGLRYQGEIEKMVNLAARGEPGASNRLMPHLYGLVGRETPICAFCWADSYGGDARRVSDNAAEAAKADDFSDLVFEG